MWYDFVCLGILIFFTIRGAMRGVIWQIAGIAGIVLCFFFAQSISAAIGPKIKLEPPLNHWVVLFGSYLFFSFVAFGLARVLNEWVEKAQLKEFNRHLGAVLGLVKGVALCLVLTFMLVTVSSDAREALKDSRSGRYAAIIMDRLHPLMPEKLHDALAEYIHKLDTPGLDLQHADHDYNHGEVLPDAAPFTPVSGDPFGQPAANPTPQQPATDFWSQLKSSLGADVQVAIINSLQTTDPSLQGQIQNQLAEVLRTTPPDQLPALRQQLLRSGTSQLDQVLGNWLQSGSVAPSTTTPAVPVSRPGPSTIPPVSGLTQSQQLIRDFAAAMSTIPQARSTIETQLTQMFDGAPESVATAVLQDWLADLRGAADPDTGTNRLSTPEQRIMRQLQLQRIPFTSLSPQMQERLRSAQAPGGSPL